MIEVLTDMPDGVAGIRVSGRLSGEDFHSVEPTLKRAMGSDDIRIVEVIASDYVGFGPGGAGDLTARLIGPKLAESLGRPVVVENRPGAGSIVAAESVARAQPDGGEAPIVFSRAGHDGMALGAITGVGMLFLRNPDGISHHPDEAVSAGDVAHGIRALFEAVTLLGHEPRG